MYREVLLVFCVFLGANSSIEFNEPCSKDDFICHTQVSDKFFTTAIRGDPDLKVKPQDPMYQKHIHGRVVTAEYNLYNSTVMGFKSCHVRDTRVILEKDIINFKLHCSRLYMYGQYAISGLLIIVPIEGNGEYSVDTKDYRFNVETTTKLIEGADGKQYLQYKNFKAVADLRGGMRANLTNLFNGQNNQLADAALRFVNEYWQPVATEFQGPIVNANIKKIMKNLNKLLKKVPLDTYFTC